MLKSEEEIKLHPPGISRLVLEHMPLIISISISFMSLNTEWSCIKETISERNCWTGLTGLSYAGRGRVGRVGQHCGAKRGLLLPLQPRWPSCCWCACASPSAPWLLMVLGSRSCLMARSWWAWAFDPLQKYSDTASLIFFLFLILTFS